ncbi:MAG: DUF5993 family protein [Parachlamydiales bacterium]
MMAALFVIFALALFLAWIGFRTAAITVALVNLLLCLAMLWHHATTILQIRL